MQTTIFKLAVLGVAGMLAFPASGADIRMDGWLDLNGNGAKDAYEDAAQPVEARVADLLAQMTPEEKFGQLSQCLMQKKSEKLHGRQLRAGLVGSFLPAGGVAGDVALRNRLQKLAVGGSRLGVPFIMGFDSIHGFRTVFPIPLAQACAWEPELFRRTQEVSAAETSATGIDWVFAPMVDLARDPRWGRIAEGLGEDPYLGALYTAASVRGFQGNDPSAPDRVAACLKHYVAYGAAEGGRDYNTTDLSEYQLRNFYLPQFRAGVDAGALTLMSAFNCINGVPASGNRHTLTEILRGEWGFRGFVVSDWESVGELRQHGVAADAAEAARLALTAGVDMEMVSTTYDTLAAQVKAGTVPQEAVDEAVRRILRVKFQRGLFDRPYTDETRLKDAFLRPEALALAREAAVKSCVLLKNEKRVLPLARTGVKIALIGPFGADKDELLGSWCGHGLAADVVPLSDGIRAKLGKDASLTIVKGCPMLLKGRRTTTLTDGSIVEDPAAPAEPADGAEFAAAVKAAAAADVVVLAVGEPRGWSGENATRSQLGLTGRQEELFEAVAAAGKPVVVVLFNGRPLAIPRLREKAAAIMEAWQPGIQGGNAVADLLFGDAEPSGRLTASFPRTVGQLPVYYNHLNTGRPQYQEYRDGTRQPLFPFGFGLAYTTFRYGKVTLAAPEAGAEPAKSGAPVEMKRGGTLTAAVSVTNTGKRAGEETVQLYIRDVAASRARPVRELKGFQKVRLEPGETKELRFTITEDALAFFDETGRRLVEPGAFELWLAPDSASGKPIPFTLER